MTSLLAIRDMDIDAGHLLF